MVYIVTLVGTTDRQRTMHTNIETGAVIKVVPVHVLYKVMHNLISLLDQSLYTHCIARSNSIAYQLHTQSYTRVH